MRRKAMYGLVNGKIYTLKGSDWEKHPASAMAVSDDGKIMKVGSDEEIKGLLARNSSNPEIRDLEGNTVFPGFVDSHTHAPGTAFTELFQINLYGAFDRETTMARIQDFVENHPDETAYFGSGFNSGIVIENPEERPVLWIDEICNDKPVILTSYDCHAKWLNSCAMSRLGIGKNTQTAGQGVISKTSAGELRGLFNDVPDIGIPDQQYTKEQNLEALKHYVKKMNKWGYTALLSQAPHFGLDAHAYSDMDAAGELTVRATIASELAQDSFEADLARLNKLRDEIKSDKLKVATAKFFVDGVLEGHTAYLKEPYREEAGLGRDYNATPEWEKAPLVDAFRAVLHEGYQIHVHSIGDAATAMALDAFEAVQDECADKDPRHTITHLHIVDPEDLDRFAGLNIIASLQTFWHLKEPDFYEYVEGPCLGEERQSRLYPAKSFVDRGVRITNSGDYPVSFMNDPFMGIRAGVTRNLYSEVYYGIEIDDIDDERFLLLPEERLNVKNMIEAYTVNGAYQIQREDEIGTLEDGKYADYIVVSADPMTADPLTIDSIHPLETVFEGKTVYAE